MSQITSISNGFRSHFISVRKHWLARRAKRYLSEFTPGRGLEEARLRDVGLGHALKGGPPCYANTGNGLRVVGALSALSLFWI